MKLRLTAFFLTIAAVLIITQLAFSQQDTLFIADFGSNALDDYAATSGWSITTAKTSPILVGESTTMESLYVSAGSAWTDYGLDVRLMLVTGSVALHARAAENACASYAFSIWSDLDLIALSVVDADCKFDTLVTSPFDFRLNQWTDVSLRVQGTHLGAWINGQEVLTAESEVYPQGAPMLMLPGFALNGAVSRVEIESIAVSPLEPILDATQLVNYAGSYQQVIAELQQLGVVPEGGSLIFQEDHAYLSGMGSYFTYLASTRPHTDVVLAATLNFEPGRGAGEYLECGISVRVNFDDQEAYAYLDAAISREGVVFAGDFVEGADWYADLFEVKFMTVDTSEPHQLIMVAMDDRLTVYLDGQRVINSQPVQSRSGTYGIWLSTDIGQSLCEGTDIWAYTFDP